MKKASRPEGRRLSGWSIRRWRGCRLLKSMSSDQKNWCEVETVCLGVGSNIAT